jgi:hypothetical protein
MKFEKNVLYVKLSNRRDFRENRRSEGHTISCTRVT